MNADDFSEEIKITWTWLTQGIHIEHLLLRSQALTFDATLIDTRICLREKGG